MWVCHSLSWYLELSNTPEKVCLLCIVCCIKGCMCCLWTGSLFLTGPNPSNCHELEAQWDRNTPSGCLAERVRHIQTLGHILAARGLSELDLQRVLWVLTDVARASLEGAMSQENFWQECATVSSEGSTLDWQSWDQSLLQNEAVYRRLIPRVFGVDSFLRKNLVGPLLIHSFCLGSFFLLQKGGEPHWAASLAERCRLFPGAATPKAQVLENSPVDFGNADLLVTILV